MGSDEIDRLLDEGLASYAAAEPRLGFEQRILRRARPRRNWRRWAVLIPALACLLLVMLYREPRIPPPPPPVAARAEVPPPLPEPRVVARGVSLPKQPEFPMRTPLTSQERAFVTFVRNAPEEALEALSQPAIQPIQIEDIRIAPLQMGDGTE